MAYRYSIQLERIGTYDVQRRGLSNVERHVYSRQSNRHIGLAGLNDSMSCNIFRTWIEPEKSRTSLTNIGGKFILFFCPEPRCTLLERRKDS